MRSKLKKIPEWVWIVIVCIICSKLMWMTLDAVERSVRESVRESQHRIAEQASYDRARCEAVGGLPIFNLNNRMVRCER